MARLLRLRYLLLVACLALPVLCGSCERQRVLAEAEPPSTLLGPAESPEPSDEARELLYSMLDAYSQIDAYHAEVLYSSKMDMGGGGFNMTQRAKQEVWFQAPREFRTELGSAGFRFVTVSDGEWVWSEIGLFGIAMKQRLPEDMSEFGRLDSPQGFAQLFSGGMGMGGMGAMLGTVDELPLALRAVSAEGLGSPIPLTEEIAELNQPAGTVGFTLLGDTGVEQHIFLDAETRRLARWTMSVTMAEMMDAMMGNMQHWFQGMPGFSDPSVDMPNSFEEFKERLGGGMSPGMEGMEGLEGIFAMFEGMTVDIAADFTHLDDGAEVPPDTFVYDPPDGIEVIEVESAADVFRALFRGMGLDEEDFAEEFGDFDEWDFDSDAPPKAESEDSVN